MATYPTELTALDGAPGDHFGYSSLATVGSQYVFVGSVGHRYIFKK